MLVTLFFRRTKWGAELGSTDPNAKHPLISSIFLAFLWFFYVLMSILQSYEVVELYILNIIVWACAGLFAIVMIGLTMVLPGMVSIA
jgi:hypothetical protein